ncbi:hypothetical protein SLEP1_g51349 [Rubroshorea leprosula]|uniref:BFN domain-containing protein n=1 Tax=Rubroshorea leprosula TaxID=152421 RepID=A0AAV5M2W9_9ROSI|nr:hypothetical protein SLEP1_g51349 [Rubroshorea leprosula]
MLAPHFRIPTITIPASRNYTDLKNVTPPIASCSFVYSPIRSDLPTKRRLRPSSSVVISCKSSPGSFGPQFIPGNDPRHEFVEASLLISETATHHRLLRKGFQETKWQSSKGLLPFVPTREPRSDVSSVGEGFLRGFRSPTIFLKISCNGHFLLPILVAEYAVESLTGTLLGDENGDSPDQFQFLKSCVEKLGYEVKMVRITEKVMNTYFSKLYFGKPGESDILSVDARASDAINIADRCKAPIYVNKKIILSDAVRIAYGMGRVRDRKPTYDVSLDSAADGPDLLSIELELVRNVALAIKEERYDDAAMWKDKLLKIRHSQDDD